MVRRSEDPERVPGRQVTGARAALVASLTLAVLVAGLVLGYRVRSVRAGSPDGAAVAGPDAGPDADAGVDPGPSAGSPSPVAQITTVDPAVAVRTSVAGYLADAGTHAALALLDRVTGEEVLYHETVRFETASVVKVDILAALLWQSQRSGTALSGDQRQNATAMITQSDNDAASELWEDIGGASGLAAANRSYELGLMGRVESDQRWGVPAAADRRATAVEVKNGWLSRSTDNGRWIVNSVGRIAEPDHEWLVVVLSNHHASEAAGIMLVQHAVDLAVGGLRGADG